MRKLTFTGSTEIGKVLMAQAAADREEGIDELAAAIPFIASTTRSESRVEGAIISNTGTPGRPACVPIACCAGRRL